MTKLRYVSTNLLTGEVLCDNIPLTVQSFGSSINGGGSLTGSLNLDEDYPVNTPYLEALTPGRTVLWALADDYPCWNGVIWDQPDQGRAAGTLPVSASTMDSVWTKRLVTSTLEYAGVDIFGVFLDLLAYGTSKTSPFISDLSPTKGPASPLIAQAARVAGLSLPEGAAAVSGVPWFASYLFSDRAQIASAWSDLVSAGLEYVFVPQLDAGGNLVTTVQLAFDTGLGRSYPESGYSVTFPGNAADYGYPVTRSQGSNYIWATAPPNGSAEEWDSQYPHGVDLSDLEAGFALCETTASMQGSAITQQAQVDAFADGQMGMATQGMTTPTIVIGDGELPGLRDVVLGDQFHFSATSGIHPPNGSQPGLQTMLRLTGWTYNPSGPQQAASLQLTTSQLITVPS